MPGLARFRWMPRPWRLALAFCLLGVSGCAMWDKQGDWGEVRHGLKNALRSGNTSGAASYIVRSKRDAYQTVFNNLTIPFASIDQMLTNITYVAVKGLNVEYEMLRTEGADGDVSYMVLFSLDVDGVWRVSFF